jgi:hypothetical protein
MVSQPTLLLAAGVLVFRDGAWEAVDREEEPGVPGPVIEYYGSVAQGGDGSTWVVGGGMFRYSSDRWTRVDPEVALAIDHPTKMVVSADGIAWFAAENGVARFVAGEPPPNR